MTSDATPEPPPAPITGLSHVQLRVTDLDSSAKWYTAVLGLERQAAAAGYVALRHRGARLVIVLSPVAGSRGEGSSAPDGSLDHLAFAVPDPDALHGWAEHLRRLGVEHGGVVLENGNPSLELRDPDGNAIELVAPGRRGR